MFKRVSPKQKRGVPLTNTVIVDPALAIFLLFLLSAQDKRRSIEGAAGDIIWQEDFLLSESIASEIEEDLPYHSSINTRTPHGHPPDQPAPQCPCHFTSQCFSGSHYLCRADDT